MSLRRRLRRRSLIELDPDRARRFFDQALPQIGDVGTPGAAVGGGRRRVGEDQPMPAVHGRDVVEADGRTRRRGDRVDQRPRVGAVGAEIDQPSHPQREKAPVARRAPARRSDPPRARDDRRKWSPNGSRSISPPVRSSWRPASAPEIPDRPRCRTPKPPPTSTERMRKRSGGKPGDLRQRGFEIRCPLASAGRARTIHWPRRRWRRRTSAPSDCRRSVARAARRARHAPRRQIPVSVLPQSPYS